MAKFPTVDAYMDTVVHTVAPDMPIHEAVNFLLKNRVTGAPVVEGDGKLVGMLTEFDCLRLLSMGDGTGPVQGVVRDFMTTSLKTIPPGMNIYFAAGIFLGNQFRRLPVVTDGKLVGAITRFDILRAIRDHASDRSSS